MKSTMNTDGAGKEMELDIEQLGRWIGKTLTETEILTPSVVRRFGATFDRDWSCETGAVAPCLIHFCLAQPVAPAANLQADGHPALGGFMPPVPLPGRMWAGGRIDFRIPIHVGDKIQRTSEIRDVTMKEGRSGALCFVTVEHRVRSNGKIAIVERQDIVYRDLPKGVAKASPVEPAPEGNHRQYISPSSTMLFRYSALTFNAHRIHYDQAYAAETEGYPGLVIHGPLQATFLCQMAHDLEGRPPKSFEFRGRSPLICDQPFALHADREGQSLRLWTAQRGGPVAMEARAEW